MLRVAVHVDEHIHAAQGYLLNGLLQRQLRQVHHLIRLGPDPRPHPVVRRPGLQREADDSEARPVVHAGHGLEQQAHGVLPQVRAHVPHRHDPPGIRGELRAVRADEARGGLVDGGCLGGVGGEKEAVRDGVDEQVHQGERRGQQAPPRQIATHPPRHLLEQRLAALPPAQVHPAARHAVQCRRRLRLDSKRPLERLQRPPHVASVLAEAVVVDLSDVYPALDEARRQRHRALIHAEALLQAVLVRRCIHPSLRKRRVHVHRFAPVLASILVSTKLTKQGCVFVMCVSYA
mmetsp:Transcript_28598/g.59798  ORF Transcript_28598/g.59798 Transcript_28598/m.59798 type:complete len:290 (+) Transcript_28598:717-1586(+)